MPARQLPSNRCNVRVIGTLHWPRLITGMVVLAGWVADGAQAPDAAAEAPVVLPRMEVKSERLDASVLIPKRDLAQPDFVGVPPEVILPHRARFERVFDGRALIGVMLDAEGNAMDFLPIKYTRQYFADELMVAIRNEKFTPRRVKGIAVPGSFYISHRFDVRGSISLTPMEAWTAQFDRITDELRGGPPFIYEPHLEHELDGHALQFTTIASPVLADGHSSLSDGKPLRIIVSFYVDEEGRIRLPNVESATPPILIASVIDAVVRWKFVPPLVAGKPVLAFATRVILLEPEAPRRPK